MSVPVVAVPGKSGLAGSFEPVLTCSTDGWPASFVLVVGGDVSEGLVQPDAVMERPHLAEFGTEGALVGDGGQVGVFAFDVTE